MSGAQERLRFGLMVDAEQLYQELLEAAERAVSPLGKGEVASQLGMQFSTFSNALRDRNRCSFKALELVALILADDGDLMLEVLARAKRKTLHHQRELTDAEKLERLRSHVRRRLGELGQDIIDEAARRG